MYVLYCQLFSSYQSKTALIIQWLLDISIDQEELSMEYLKAIELS